MLLKRAYTKSEFERMISETKFRDFQIREDLIGLEVLLSKVARGRRARCIVPYEKRAGWKPFKAPREMHSGQAGQTASRGYKMEGARLFVAEDDHGVEVRGAAGGQIAGEQCSAGENYGNGEKSDRVGRADTIKQRR